MMRSLRGRLFLSLTVFIVLVGAAAGVVAYHWAFDEAIELQDSTLVQIGALAVSSSVRNGAVPPVGIDDEARVTLDDLNNAQHTETVVPPLATFPDGLHTALRGGKSWRFLLTTRPDGHRIAVAQPTAVRNEIANDSALRTILPLAALIPFLMAICGLVIRQTFRPVLSIASQLDTRRSDDFETLPLSQIPRELLSFVESINRLLDRTKSMVDLQRRFVADAAHELRSPIAALSIQADNLGETNLPVDARERFMPLQQGISRTARLLEQLLSLAKHDAGGAANTSIRLDFCAREVVAGLLPLASEAEVDLGFEAIEPATIRGDPSSVEMMMRNVILNAIQHTPRGGSVNLRIFNDAESAIFCVEDNGPGIPDDDLNRVFEPFVRGTRTNHNGSGLGLSIVKRIADNLGGTVTLSNFRDEHRTGLRVLLRFDIQLA